MCVEARGAYTIYIRTFGRCAFGRRTVRGSLKLVGYPETRAGLFWLTRVPFPS